MDSQPGSDKATPSQEPGSPEVGGPAPSPDGQQSEQPKSDGSNAGSDSNFKYGEDETQDFVDRSKIDFDPVDGLYTGSAVDGGSDIPGPNEAEIRAAQEELGDDQGNNAGEVAAAEKYIEEHDVDLEEAKKGEAISGSAQGAGGGGTREAGEKSASEQTADDEPGDEPDDEHPKPFPHDGKGPDGS